MNIKKERLYGLIDGNPGAMSVLFNVLGSCASEEQQEQFVSFCERLDIKGAKLYMLMNDCCKNDMDNFKKTMAVLNSGAYSNETISHNLSLCRAMPFIDLQLATKFLPEQLKDKEFLKKYAKQNAEIFTPTIERLYKEETQFGA